MIQSLSQLRQQFLVRPSRSDEFPEDDPRRLHSLSLEQQKKRAKDLLKALRAGDGWQRVQTIPALSETVSPDTVKLADAQWVIARENGFYSWPKMKRHIETEDSARAMIASGRTEASGGAFSLNNNLAVASGLGWDHFLLRAWPVRFRGSMA